jgi:hypothetical protein
MITTVVEIPQLMPLHQSRTFSQLPVMPCLGPRNHISHTQQQQQQQQAEQLGQNRVYCSPFIPHLTKGCALMC